MPPKTKATPAAEKTPQTKDEWFALGEKLEADEDFRGAFGAFTKALELDPSWSYPRFRAAQISVFNLQDIPEAIALLDATPPGVVDSDLTYVYGRALAEAGRVDEAIAKYAKALDEVDSNPEKANDRCDILCALALDLRDRIPEGLKYSEDACAADRTKAHAWEVVGYFQYLSGDKALALRSLRLACALEESMADSLREDPDFGAFRAEPAFVSMLEQKPLDGGALGKLPSLWPPGDPHAALPRFLDAVNRAKLLS